MSIKVGSDFSGVGAFEQALNRLGIEHEVVFACDKDKYARLTYVHNYGEPKCYPMDVYEREIPGDSLDIYMTSPPCQSFSLGGKHRYYSEVQTVEDYKNREKHNNYKMYNFLNKLS